MKKMQKRLHIMRNECECRENDAETLTIVREFTKYSYTFNICMERQPKDVSDGKFSTNSISNIYKWAHL